MNFDFGRFMTETQEQLSSSDMSREEMLAEARESLRDLKKGLVLYQQIMGPTRGHMHQETLGELGQLWKEYADDDIGLFEDADVIELLARVRSSNAVQSTVFERYSKGELRAHDEIGH